MVKKKFKFHDIGVPSVEVSTLPPEWQALFVTQHDSISCGPACAATVGKILGHELEYADFRSVARPSKKIGTSMKKMVTVCEDLLPISQGSGTYHGGLAIACILKRPYMVGHYVVFLHYDDKGRVIYYCPYDNRIFIKMLKDVPWISETEKIPYWSINFPTPEFLKDIPINL